MIIRILSLIATISFLINQMQAQVNFSEHIAPIIYQNCTSCHRSGEIGPMSFTNYQEVADWASTIAYVTSINYMPPWQPNKAYSHFVGERGLSDSEIQLIADWVDAGTPQGDPTKEPPLPYFPQGSQLGASDLVLTMKESYTIKGNNEDDYRVFVLPSNLSEDKEIAAIEFRPGNSRAVHHALIAYDTKQHARFRDDLTSAYGYSAFGDFGIVVDGYFNGYTPGIQSLKYPREIGKVLPANADILIQIHYAPLPTDETDKSSVNIFFKEASDKIKRPIESLVFTPYDIPFEDGAQLNFHFFPNQKKKIRGKKKIYNDISLVSVYPHCHYLGKAWKIFALTPKKDTINILEIKDWDFNWQGAYTFKALKKIPSGSTIYADAWYDNTADNPFNPSNPPVYTTWGEKTTDEMYIVGLNYVEYRTGDENIRMEEGLTTATTNKPPISKNILYPPFPNPSKDHITLKFYLAEQQPIMLTLYDLSGKQVKTLTDTTYSSGNHELLANVTNLEAGSYLIKMMGEGFVMTEQLVVLKNR